MLTLVAFVAVEFLYQTNPQTRLYQIIFMCAANCKCAGTEPGSGSGGLITAPG